MWPGFCENMRVLKWIVDRVNGKEDAEKSPFGHVPNHDDIQWSGLSFGEEAFNALMDINNDDGKKEADDQKGHFDKFGDKLPSELEQQRQELIERLNK